MKNFRGLAYFDGFDFIGLDGKTLLIGNLMVIQNLDRTFMHGQEIPYV